MKLCIRLGSEAFSLWYEEMKKKNLQKTKRKITLKQWKHRSIFGGFYFENANYIHSCRTIWLWKLQLDSYFMCFYDWNDTFLMHIFASFWRTVAVQTNTHTHARVQTKLSQTDNWQRTKLFFFFWRIYAPNGPNGLYIYCIVHVNISILSLLHLTFRRSLNRRKKKLTSTL